MTTNHNVEGHCANCKRWLPLEEQPVLQSAIGACTNVYSDHNGHMTIYWHQACGSYVAKAAPLGSEREEPK